MPEAKYERRLLERGHSKRRWENEPAEWVSIKDIDRAEVYRTVEVARAKGHLTEPVGSRLPGVLDRLDVRKDDRILQAAVVLFGKEFMPDYAQCELRMARSRGLDKTEFMDQKNVRGPAFTLLEEAEVFCQRHLRLPGKLQREDRPLIPPDAMREILVNAIIHRDCSNVGGAIYLAIFDDRVEVWSTGTFPTGITPEMLSREQKSILRNPMTTDVFHRAGLIEKWGRGSNRVIEICRNAGIRPPQFHEIAGSAVVKFHVPVGGTGQVADQVTPQVTRVLQAASSASSFVELQAVASLKDRVHFLKTHLEPLLLAGWIKPTIPDKPRSSKQKYRLTPAGANFLTNVDGFVRLQRATTKRGRQP